MRTRFSIISLWIAAIMMLLSTVVAHHHHYERICIAIEECIHDLPIAGDAMANELMAEESHTHQESGGCRIHQLHKFIISSGVAKHVHKYIRSEHTFAYAILPDAAWLPDASGDIVACWQHHATPLSLRILYSLVRRGPPVF